MPAPTLRRRSALALLAISSLTAAAGGTCAVHERPGRALFASPQANPIALTPDGSRAYVANTTSASVSAIDTTSLAVVAEIPVGLEPVGVAAAPTDGRSGSRIACPTR